MRIVVRNCSWNGQQKKHSRILQSNRKTKSKKGTATTVTSTNNFPFAVCTTSPAAVNWNVNCRQRKKQKNMSRIREWKLFIPFKHRTHSFNHHPQPSAKVYKTKWKTERTEKIFYAFFYSSSKEIRLNENLLSRAFFRHLTQAFYWFFHLSLSFFCSLIQRNAFPPTKGK